MAFLFWDASALVKRYLVELGSDSVNTVFASSVAQVDATTAWGYAETYSILLRRFNAGFFDMGAFTAAVSTLQAEVVDSGRFDLMGVDETTVFASISTMRLHSLNATDAVL